MFRYKIILSLLLFGLYSCDTETVRMDDYKVHGIDVSHYQGEINWGKVKAQDVHFAFVKVTEADDFEDKQFCRNWDEMKKANIKRGAYHFFRPQVPVKIQIKNYIDNVDLEKGDLPPVLDVEVFDGISKVKLIRAMREWLYSIELHYNIKPIIYTNLKFYNKNLAGHFNGYPLWIARYNSREPRLVNNEDWLFWQYGDKGRIDGIDGWVDFNVFNGSFSDLETIGYSPAATISEYLVDATSL